MPTIYIRRKRLRRPVSGICAALTLWALAFTCETASAQDFDLGGYIEAEARLFPYDPAFEDQDDTRFSPSIALVPELLYSWNGGNDTMVAKPFFRADAEDSERTHFDIRTLSWTRRAPDWDLVLGVDRVFWGVAESRHLVNIVNQVDLVEDIDEEEWLGQPMANLRYFSDFGAFDLFVLPGFRERTFPDDTARLRGSAPVIVDDARYESGAEQYHVDLAVRWRHTIDEMDIGFSHFHGTGREPQLISETRAGRTVLVPYYAQIDQSAVDAQITTGSWLFKFEGLVRSGQGDRFAAAVGGFEYTITGVADTRADLGILAEYHFDGRSAEAPPTLFDEDVFVGMRYTLNDAAGTAILVGAIVDQSDQATLLTLEAEHRLSDAWKLEADVRFFVNVSDTAPVLSGIARDDYVRLRLLRHF